MDRWRDSALSFKDHHARRLGVSLACLERVPVGLARERVRLEPAVFGDGFPVIRCHNPDDHLLAAVWAAWAGHGTVSKGPWTGGPCPMLVVGADLLFTQRMVAEAILEGHDVRLMEGLDVLKGSTPMGEFLSRRALPDWRRRWASGMMSPKGDPLWVWPGVLRMWELVDKNHDADLGRIENHGVNVNVRDLTGGRVGGPRELGERLAAAVEEYKQENKGRNLWAEGEGQGPGNLKYEGRRSSIETLRRRGRGSSTTREPSA